MNSDKPVSIYLDKLREGIDNDTIENIKKNITSLFNENEKKNLILKCTNELLESKYKSLQRLTKKTIMNYGDLIKTTDKYVKLMKHNNKLDNLYKIGEYKSNNEDETNNVKPDDNEEKIKRKIIENYNNEKIENNKFNSPKITINNYSDNDQTQSRYQNILLDTEDILKRVREIKEKIADRYNLSLNEEENNEYKEDENKKYKEEDKENKKEEDNEEMNKYKHPESYYIETIKKLKSENLYLQKHGHTKIGDNKENTVNLEEKEYDDNNYEYSFNENLNMFYNDVLDIFLSKNHNYEQKYYQIIDLYTGSKSYFLNYVSPKIIAYIDNYLKTEDLDYCVNDDDFKSLCLDFYDLLYYRLISEYLDIKEY